MSELRRVGCAGAPRDLGLDQGRAARAEIRGLPPSALARRAARDLERFFPHHAERLQGISLGAGVGERALFTPLTDFLAGDGGLAVAVVGKSGPLLARTVPAAPASLLLRESAPDNDYRSLELAPAASVASWIGVNEHGLAATAIAASAPEAALAGCAAPALLLVQDVLQRFDTAEKAADWALRRPAGGCATLLLADAAGRIAKVEIEGRVRKLDEVAAVGVAGDLNGVLAKRFGSAGAFDAETLAAILTAGRKHVSVADPRGLRLGFALGEAPLAWHELSAAAPR